jgi:phage gpG-like protein
MHIDIDMDSSGAKLKLNNIGVRINNPILWWGEVEDSLTKYTASNFTLEGLPVGGWKPLDARYAAWKAVRFPAAPMLVRTGRLMQSALNPTVSIMGPSERRYTASVNYAGFHQYGTSKMAKRQVMFVNEEFAQEIAFKLGRYISGKTATDGV